MWKVRASASLWLSDQDLCSSKRRISNRERHKEQGRHGAAERGQRSPRNDPRLEQLCWGQVRELGCSAGEQKLQGDLSAAFPDLKRANEKDGDRLLSRACCQRTRGDGFKLKKGYSGQT